MRMKNGAKLEEEFTFVSKLTWGLWWILAWALENLNNLLFNGLPLTKLYYVRVKKVQRSYVWWHLILTQNLNKTDFCFHKWHEEFGKLSPEYLKVSKLGLWLSFLIQSRNFMSLKFKGSYLSWQWRMMPDWRRNWLVVSKLTWRIWQILTRALKSLKNVHLHGLPLTKVYNTWV